MRGSACDEDESKSTDWLVNSLASWSAGDNDNTAPPSHAPGTTAREERR